MALSLNKIFIDADKAREKFWMDIITVFKTVATVLKTGKFPETLETPQSKMTKEGGYAIKMQNRTGATSIRGTIVEISPDYDESVKTAVANSTAAIGTIYESGIKNGFDVWVTVHGAGYILMADGTAAVLGEYATTGAVAGRGYSTTAIPTNGAVVGSITKSKEAGQGKTTTFTLHFSGAAGDGSVSAAQPIADNAMVRGDGGAKGIQQATNITVSDLDEIENIGAICFDTDYAEPIAEGCVAWSPDEGTLAVGMPGGNVLLNAGMELFLPRRADNKTGATIPNGTFIYIDGGTGNNFSVDLADKRYHATAGRTIAMTTEAIANNAKGYCTTFGLVRGDALQPINTSPWTPGTLLWLGNDGTFSATKPAPPDAPIEVGIVFRQHATEGAVFVRIQKQPLELTRAITREPSGFGEPYGVDCEYDSTARTITLTEKVLDAGIPFYWQGEPVESLVDGWESDPHPDVPGSKYMLQYNGTVFEWVDLDAEGLEFYDAFVGFVNYDAVNPFGIVETHGLMQWQNHQEFHEQVGTYKETGVGAILGNYELDSTLVLDRRPSVSASVLWDEDNPTDVASVADNSIYPNYYLSSGGDANYNLTATGIVPLNGSRPYYNQNVAGTWQQTLISNNYYMNIWQLQMPVTSDTESQQYRNLWVQGQTQWASASGADGETTASINLGELGLLTNELLFVNKVTIRYQGGNWHITAVAVISGSKFSQVSTPSGTTFDNDAVHVNVAGEIAAITAKTTPVAADIMLIEDSADGNAKKSVTLATLLSGSASDILSTLTQSLVAINSATTLTSTAFGKMHTVVDTGTPSEYTITLPAASGNAGKHIGFQGLSSAVLTKFIKVDANGSELIGVEPYEFIVAGRTFVLECDGVGWKIIAQNEYKLPSSLVYNGITSAMAASEINTVFRQLPKNLNGYNLGAQFTAGTYTVSEPILVSSFKGGAIQVLGDATADFNLTPDVILNMTGTLGMWLMNCDTAQVFGLKVNESLENSTGVLFQNCMSIVCFYSYVACSITTTNTTGIQVSGSTGTIYKNYLSNLQYGLGCTESRLVFNTNQSTGTAPTFGNYVNNASNAGAVGSQLANNLVDSTSTLLP